MEGKKYPDGESNLPLISKNTGGGLISSFFNPAVTPSSSLYLLVLLNPGTSFTAGMYSFSYQSSNACSLPSSGVKELRITIPAAIEVGRRDSGSGIVSEISEYI